MAISILGGTPEKIVDHGGNPSVSPDGSLVAFNRLTLSEIFDIWLVGANGEGPRRIRAPPSPKPTLDRCGPRMGSVFLPSV